MSEEESSEEEADDDERPTAARAPPPKASTFPKKLAVDVSKAGQQTSRPAAPQAKPPDEDLEGFVTASESSEDEDGPKGSGESSGSEEDSSEEEESSSDDEPAKPMIRPTFMSKAKRAQQLQSTASSAPSVEEKAAAEEVLRKEKADAVLQAHLDRDAAARAAGKKYWDDEDIAPEDEVDDTDDLDPEAELAAWKLRELKRVRRDRAAIEEKEKEREEIERRRNMTAEEREAEDKEFIEAQKEAQEGRGKMGYMQKYFHKGAFFGGEGEDVDEEVKAALNRDLAGAKFEDEAGDKSLLPEYMRVRDMTRLGRKGRSKYKDLKSEDTGRWGADVGRRKREFGDVQDERFRPDDDRGGGRERPTGANNAALGERKRPRHE